MNRSILALTLSAAATLAACDKHPEKPVTVCAEKANLRMVSSRGGSHEAFDCQRYKLTCIEPLELFDSSDGIRCRLPKERNP